MGGWSRVIVFITLTASLALFFGWLLSYTDLFK
jgi:hypothetical protein